MSNGEMEIISGKERRRRGGLEEKLRIVAESQEPGASVRGVAVRNDVYTVVPRAGKYWIVEIAKDGSRQTIEQFDTEDAAVRRLRALQKSAGIVDEWNTPSPRR
jgi:transposase-like protein